MRTKSNELLAVGIFGNKSHLCERIEKLVSGSRTFSPRASAPGVAAGAIALAVFLLAGSAAPRWIAFAQQTSPGPFDVISVKPDTSNDRNRGIEFTPGGRFRAMNLPLQLVIASAYNVPFQSSQLTGGPAWIKSDRFDIEATAGAGAFPAGISPQARMELMRGMMQALLADRFKLSIRRETKVIPVYRIVVAKSGPKLEPSKIAEKDCPDPLVPGARGELPCHAFNGGRGRGLHGQAVDLADLVRTVGNWTDRPVVDATGITGLFHIETKPWRPMEAGLPPAPGAKAEDGSEFADLPTIYEVFEQLGLKMEAGQAPVESFFIDHAEKPNAN